MSTPECETPLNKQPEEMIEISAGEIVDTDILGLAYEAGLLQNRRRSPRRKIHIRVSALPIDENGRQVGNPFVAESKNLSATGICLIHSQPVNARYLLVELPGCCPERQCAVVEIIRCVPSEGEYELAGPFVSLAEISDTSTKS